MHWFFGKSRLIISFCFIIMLLVCALAAPVLSPYPADRVYDDSADDLAEAFTGPTWAHPFGKDDLGRDVLSRMIWGSRVSLLVGFAVVGISLFLGLVLGVIAGYFRGWLDEMIMRTIDLLLAFPGILFAIGIIAILGPGTLQTIFALCLTGWVSYARLVRGLVLAEWGKNYIQSAIVLGARPFRTIIVHILPNIMSPIMIKATFGLAGAIMAEASLSFLGLGVQPPTPSWGNMLNLGAKYLILPEAWHLTVFPGLAIVLLIMAINILGEALRDRFDPGYNDEN